jgi:hypothetical protein
MTRDIVFLNRNTIDNADCTMSDVRMRIYSNGNVFINNNLNCGTLQIGGSDFYYYLFDNTGGDMNVDFNNVGNFGCKFIYGGTNGPGTPSTYNHWYTMCLGLGSNYNWVNLLVK